MWKSLATVRKYLWRYRWGLALGGVCLVLKDLAQAAQPLMIRGAIDALAGRGAPVRPVRRSTWSGSRCSKASSSTGCA